MKKSVCIHATVDESTKENARAILLGLGMNISQAIAIYLKQIVIHKGIPFEIKIPNQVTLHAIQEAKEDKDLERFASVDELFDTLKQ
jgi:DNA-damage-inducible protein J